MIVLSLTDENEIGANMDDIEVKLSSTDYYPDLFNNAFGSPTIDDERIVDALVQFINSMVTLDSKFDSASDNDFKSFTDEELNGLELFSTNCTVCHSQGSHSLFRDIDFFPPGSTILETLPFIFNNGLPKDSDDQGAGEWDGRFDNLFKIPTLRNVALTAPYMHDGRFETLDEVLNHYSEEIERDEWNPFIEPGGFNFTNNEKKSLIAFLETLTDESFKTNENWSNPFSGTSLTPDLLDFEFVIKPNPMLSEAIIAFKNPNNDVVNINILSSTGQLIENRKINGTHLTLDKNKFGSGMYFIEVILGNNKSLKKLIVQ